MLDDKKALYAALLARDARFDGRFFVGVSSTGVYCRPICRVKAPKFEHCAFFATAAEAEQAGYRPCLRASPELAPGSPPLAASPSPAPPAAPPPAGREGGPRGQEPTGRMPCAFA